MKFFSGLTPENIALLSVIITLLLYVLGKRSELKLKKHELRKDEYIQFINMLKDIYLNQDFKLSGENKEKFFDLGAALFVYGSKKMYKKYCFFRNFQTSIISITKYYDSNLSLFLVADMLNQIRKEISFNTFELNLKYDAIAFYTNDIINNPVSKIKWYKDKYKVRMIKIELFFLDIYKLVPLNFIYYKLIKPIISILIVIVRIFILLPLGQLLLKMGFKLKNGKLTRK